MADQAAGDETETKTRLMLNALGVYWRTIVLFVTPLIFLPIMLLNNDPPHRCLYVVAVMAIYWITEALPLAVTSIIPMFMFPLMGVLDSNKTCMCYFKETNVMFIGGLIVALAIQHSRLHMRVALKTVLIIGCSPKRLNLGMMIVTMFVSMWISNTAATAMMSPVIEATLRELEIQGLGKMFTDEDIMTADGEIVKKPSQITVGNFMSIAFSATVGGVGTLIGTGTNLTLKGIYESAFPDSPGITFMDWMAFGVPIMIATQILVGGWMQICYFGLWRPNSEAAKNISVSEEASTVARRMVQDRYVQLGPMTFHEIMVCVTFIIAVLLWFFRRPNFMKGWPELMTDKQVGDGATAMLVVVVMFYIPAYLTFLNIFDPDKEKRPKINSQGLITWKECQAKVSWGLVFLLGGGFAVAEGSKESGMSKMLANSLKPLTSLPKFVVMLVVCVFASILTDFSANVAIANIILPVLADMSVIAKWHPLYLMMPATIACSHSYSLPVSTPPNALIQGPANIPTTEFLKAGIMASLVSLVPLAILGPPLNSAIFKVDEFPSWANQTTEKAAAFSYY